MDRPIDIFLWVSPKKISDDWPLLDLCRRQFGCSDTDSLFVTMFLLVVLPLVKVRVWFYDETREIFKRQTFLHPKNCSFTSIWYFSYDLRIEKLIFSFSANIIYFRLDVYFHTAVFLFTRSGSDERVKGLHWWQLLINT